MPPAARRAAFEAGLAAYADGDFFLAHELLEPPWMGTSDLAERELIQGVIKLAAAFVHDARSNPAGIEKNLRGARDRLAGAGRRGVAARASTCRRCSRRSIEGWRQPRESATRRDRDPAAAARDLAGPATARSRGLLRVGFGNLRLALELAANPPLADLGPVVERPADDHEDHEVARADARRGEIPELRADRAADLEARGQSRRRSRAGRMAPGGRGWTAWSSRGDRRPPCRR